MVALLCKSEDACGSRCCHQPRHGPDRAANGVSVQTMFLGGPKNGKKKKAENQDYCSERAVQSLQSMQCAALCTSHRNKKARA